MRSFENRIKEYSSKKLLAIIENQSTSYSEEFIDYVKDELIKRGEVFQFNQELEKEIMEMNDEHLKNLIEKEWDNYHLEYIEIARNEYIKRGFKNETIEEFNDEVKDSLKKENYPALRGLISAGQILAYGYAILSVILAFYLYKDFGLELSLGVLLMGFCMFIFLLASSESIKIFIDIEKNTRAYRKDSRK